MQTDAGRSASAIASARTIQQSPVTCTRMVTLSPTKHCEIDLMLLRGLSWLIIFQLLGTAANVLFLPFLPGPIIGMVLLVVFLRLRGQVSAPLERASTGLLKYLPLFLVPPATGIMMYGREIA